MAATDVTKPLYSTRTSAYIARVYAERNMTATVVITRPAAPGFRFDTGLLDAESMGDVYDGKARVYTVSGPVTMGIGDEPTYYSSTFVSVPLEELIPGADIPPSPRVDDIVRVTAHLDPLMLGRFFRVVDVEAGSQFPACRRMQCVGIQDSKQWGDGSIPAEWIIR